MKRQKVALVHDYLVTFGGAERVLLALHEIWPHAPVYLAIYNPQTLGRHWHKFQHWDLRPSWFQKLPFANRLISPFRFLLPYIWESFDLSSYDLVISSSAWAMSKAVLTPSTSKHVCYCHTPPRFLYGYPGARPWQHHKLVKLYAHFINHHLRIYDYLSSQRVDYFIANSQEVARRIQKFWRRQAQVIYPPIDIPAVLPSSPKRNFYLYVSRLVSYKHPLLAAKACHHLRRHLTIVGQGPLEKKVAHFATQSPYIHYLGHISDQRLHHLYQQAKALIFPAESEDLGMVPLEAAAWGTPTIAYYSGGAKETVRPQNTGLFFSKLTQPSLIHAILKFEKNNWSAKICYQWARRFRKENFQKAIRRFVAQHRA